MQPLKSFIFWKIYLINVFVILILFLFTVVIAQTVLPEISKNKNKMITDKAVLRIYEQAYILNREIFDLVKQVERDQVYVRGNPKEMGARLNEIVDLSSLIDGGTVLSPQMAIQSFYVGSDLDLLKDSSLLKDGVFDRTIEEMKASVSDVVVSELGKYALIIVIPVQNDSRQVVRMVTLHVYIDKNAIFQSIFQSNDISESGYISIVDRNGIVLSHPDNQRIGHDASEYPLVRRLMNQESGYEEASPLFDLMAYASFRYVDFLGWGIIAQIPATDIFESAQAFQSRLLPLFLLVTLLLSLLTALYARQIIKPIRRLYQAVDQVARGNYVHRIAKIDRTELGKLSIRLNEMIDSLQAAKEDIGCKERQLQEQKDFLRHVIDMNPSYIYAKDREGKYVLVNESLAKLLGTTADQLVGRKVVEFRRAPAEPAGMADVPMPEESSDGTAAFEETITASDGSVRWVHTVRLPIASSEGKMENLLCVSTDITERKRTEELLRKSEKLSVVGELAAGVAHEIRNPLTSLKGFLQLLRSRGDASQERFFEIMVSEIDRINFIVNEFLMLAKPQAVRFQRVELLPLVHNVLVLLETQAILTKVNIVTDFTKEPLWIEGEENQLKQVFINIVKNGIEAMPEGGDFRIEVCTSERNEAVVRFIDQGHGIPPELLKKLGEPFYTTKEKGTGLGLMVSFKIIEAHRGRILIESEIGRGTQFEVILPLAP
ncbi:ATP-binding protein [Paenibacillus ginsengihumi]|uniref:ATP-binding protein n=1 Tax=Paenibacillus ginsengihumi TaxID=431596 RepID=UPI00036841CE|nr:ATP-binding protein [Paenibacillus ginsengihumi]